MLKKFLFWLASFRKSHVVVEIKVVENDQKPRDEVVFYDVPLCFLRGEEFLGLKELHKLSVRLRRPITLYDIHGCLDDYHLIGEIYPESTREALEEIAKRVETKCGFYRVMPENINLPWETKPRIYV